MSEKKHDLTLSTQNCGYDKLTIAAAVIEIFKSKHINPVIMASPIREEYYFDITLAHARHLNKELDKKFPEKFNKNIGQPYDRVRVTTSDYKSIETLKPK